MAGGGKGGSSTTTTKVELPPWLEEEAKRNLNIGNEVAAIGPTPYRGPTVAAFSPQQINSMAGVDQMAQAFGMPSQGTDMRMSHSELRERLTGLPDPTRVKGGGYGYSPYENYMKQLNTMSQPQRDFIDSFFIDPKTGAMPANPTVGYTEYNPAISPAANRSLEGEYQTKLKTLEDILAENEQEEQTVSGAYRFDGPAS